MKKIFIYLLFFYINNLYADKNIIDEKISNWYSNLCSSNIEGVVSLYSSNKSKHSLYPSLILFATSKG